MNRSILLGAGFSANQGYPTRDKLNSLLLNPTGEEIRFHTDGQLYIPTADFNPSFPSSFELDYGFSKDLITLYNQKYGHFDYEEFYDFIQGNAFTDKDVEALAKKFTEAESGAVRYLLGQIKTILNQLLSYHLKDRNGRQFYDDQPYNLDSYYPGYSGIIRCLKNFSQDSVLHVHTLNHDLFFERFNTTDFFEGKLCDGFAELGSPYYGTIHHEGRVYNCRIERYNGRYETNVRLYKLHGSLDYVVYHKTIADSNMMTHENYVKTRFGMGFANLYKEIETDGRLSYEKDWINYHADFLVGTTSKILRYNEPLLYAQLFKLFQENLNNSNMLAIIGYGGGDSEINKMLLEEYDFRHNPSFIIDINPSEKLRELAKAIGAKVITKNLDGITMADFNI